MLRSWDRFEIPKPFSRALFVYGEPIEVPRRISAEEEERLRVLLETRLNALSEEAERDFDRMYREAI